MNLRRVVDALGAFHGPPPAPPTRDPFEMVLWEAVAYLVPDERRAEAFAELRNRVGTTPDAILAAPPDTLLEIARKGGMHPARRVERLREIARIAKRDFAGDLAAAIEEPFPKARRRLQAFPGIGAPGAEKILLFAGGSPVLALDSNGLRVLLRLGFGEERRSYAASYRDVQRAASAGVRPNAAFFARAHGLLRRHGQELCKASTPLCPSCPLAGECRHFQGR